MDRRAVLLGLVAAPAFSAAAQTTPSMGTTATSAGPAPAEVMGLGDAEKQHIVQTLTVGALSLAASKAALARAQGAKVKEFARFEVAEQETIANVLAAVKAAANDMTPAPELDVAANATLHKLTETAPAAFDVAYIAAEVEGHTKLMRIQEDYLAVGKNLDSMNIAKLASGMIKEHLALLQDLEAGRG